MSETQDQVDADTEQAVEEALQVEPAQDDATAPDLEVESKPDASAVADVAEEEEGTDADDDDSQSTDDGEKEGAEPVSKATLDAEGDIAADYLEELLDIIDMDGDIDTFTEGDRAHVSIVTESPTLVGKNGEVLDALQELARLAVLTETGHRSRLILDIAGHRDKRRKELLIMAQEAVTEVKASGEPVRLPAMNPFERKIVHDAVAEAGLVSESEGVEPQRRVVISAK